MGFKEIVQKMGEASKNRKEKIRTLDENIRLSKLVQDRMKSSNERELERYQDEDREEEVKEALDYMRKKRQEDINFNHNPIDAENITSHVAWSVLKEKNMFAGKKKNMFVGQPSVLHSNRNLLKSGMRLIG